jgi:isoleucyl-tRNA synthetase
MFITNLVKVAGLVTLSSGDVELDAQDLELRVHTQEGFAVSRDGAEVVALDLVVSDALRHRGYVRDLVRQIQDLRKQSGFDVADRVVVHLTGVDDLVDSFPDVAREVLAREVLAREGVGEGTALEFDDARVARAWVTRVA